MGSGQAVYFAEHPFGGHESEESDEHEPVIPDWEICSLLSSLGGSLEQAGDGVEFVEWDELSAGGGGEFFEAIVISGEVIEFTGGGGVDEDVGGNARCVDGTVGDFESDLVVPFGQSIRVSLPQQRPPVDGREWHDGRGRRIGILDAVVFVEFGDGCQRGDLL